MPPVSRFRTICSWVEPVSATNPLPVLHGAFESVERPGEAVDVSVQLHPQARFELLKETSFSAATTAIRRRWLPSEVHASAADSLAKVLVAALIMDIVDPMARAMEREVCHG